MVDVKTPKITKIANQLYDVFKDNYIFYLEQWVCRIRIRLYLYMNKHYKYESTIRKNSIW